MKNPAINLTREEYFSFKEKGLTDKQIASEINTLLYRVSMWKSENLTKEESQRTAVKRHPEKSTFKPLNQSKDKVHVWYMTEEERLAYIAKHPIKSAKRKKQ